MLSVTRCITIMYGSRVATPRRYVFILTAGYAVLSLVVAVLKKVFEDATYVAEIGFCVGLQKEDTSAAWNTFTTIVLVIQIGTVSAVLFVSFVVSVYKLRGSIVTRSMKTRHRVSVTIAMITGMFLACNLPLFVNTCLQVISHNMKYPEPYFTSRFMGCYSWIIAKILLPVLSMTLNPVVMCWRIPGFAIWMRFKGEVPEGRLKRRTTYLESLTRTLTVNPNILPVGV